MPVLIGDESFSHPMSDEKYQRMLTALGNIDEPTVLPLYREQRFSASTISAEKKEENVDPKKFVFCFQREFASITLSDESSVIGFGTKDLYSCIFLHLQQGNRHFAVHRDTEEDLDLTQHIKGFVAGKLIEATLIGASIEHENSRINLLVTFQNLLDYSDKNKTNIRIVKQLILERNTTEKNKHEYMLREMRSRAELLFYCCFDKPVDKSCLADEKIEDAIPSLTPKKLTEIDMESFVNLLSSISEINDFSLCAAMEKIKKAGEKQFHALFKNLFQKQWFALFDKLLRIPSARFSHFIFYCKERSVMPIYEDFFVSSDEDYRIVCALDPSSIQPYRNCYHEASGEYIVANGHIFYFLGAIFKEIVDRNDGYEQALARLWPYIAFALIAYNYDSEIYDQILASTLNALAVFSRKVDCAKKIAELGKKEEYHLFKAEAIKSSELTFLSDKDTVNDIRENALGVQAAYLHPVNAEPETDELLSESLIVPAQPISNAATLTYK